MRKRKRQIGREAASHGIRLGDVADEVVPVHETVQSEGEYDFSENASVWESGFVRKRGFTSSCTKDTPFSLVDNANRSACTK